MKLDKSKNFGMDGIVQSSDKSLSTGKPSTTKQGHSSTQVIKGVIRLVKGSSSRWLRHKNSVQAHEQTKPPEKPSDSVLPSRSPSVTNNRTSSPFSSSPTYNEHSSDVPPVGQSFRPLIVTLNGHMCTLPMEGTSKKLFYSSNPSYSFVSDAACEARNRMIDRSLLQDEKEALNSTSYQKMHSLAFQVDAVLPKDHFSLEFTQYRYKSIRQRENRILALLYDRLQKDSCFYSVNKKYDELGRLLSFDNWGVWRDILAVLQNHTATPSQRDSFYAYRQRVSIKRAEAKKKFLSQSFISEGRVCDGCPSEIPKQVPYTHLPSTDIQIRKFVGDEEVPYSDKSSFYLHFLV